MLSPMTLYLDWPSIVNKFQVQKDFCRGTGAKEEIMWFLPSHRCASLADA
jgi:hypothetical protein